MIVPPRSDRRGSSRPRPASCPCRASSFACGTRSADVFGNCTRREIQVLSRSLPGARISASTRLRMSGDPRRSTQASRPPSWTQGDRRVGARVAPRCTYTVRQVIAGPCARAARCARSCWLIFSQFCSPAALRMDLAGTCVCAISISSSTASRKRSPSLRMWKCTRRRTPGRRGQRRLSSIGLCGTRRRRIDQRAADAERAFAHFRPAARCILHPR